MLFKSKTNGFCSTNDDVHLIGVKKILRFSLVGHMLYQTRIELVNESAMTLSFDRRGSLFCPPNLPSFFI
jgi:hypothetical protein